MIDSFEWFGSETAPKDYPIYVVEAAFELVDGTLEGVPDRRMTNGGWGKPGSIQIIGSTLKAVPEALDVRWYDFFGDKGYAGRCALPAEAIAAQMHRGAPSEIRPEWLPFTVLTVGMAPGGDVGIWLGAERISRLVGLYRVGPASIALSQMSKDPTLSKGQFVDKMLGSVMTPAQIAAVRTRPPSDGNWRALDRRFAWRPAVIGASAPDLLWLTFANGECDWFDLSGRRMPDTSSPVGALAVPEQAEIGWTGADGTKALGEVMFDVDEAKVAFETLGSNQKQPLQLIFEPADRADHVVVSLRNHDSIYVFRKTQTSIMRA